MEMVAPARAAAVGSRDASAVPQPSHPLDCILRSSRAFRKVPLRPAAPARTRREEKVLYLRSLMRVGLQSRAAERAVQPVAETA